MSTKAAWAVAAIATLGMSVSYIDRQTLAAIAVSVRAELHIDHTHFGWLVSAFSMAYLVGAPVAGIVVDRLGARRGFAVAVIVWSLVAGAHAFAVSFGTLFLLRILLGAAEAPSFPAAAQAIRRALPGARRPLAFGLLFTGSSIGAIVAAKLAVRLNAVYGFRGAFVGTALLGTLWIPCWLLITKNRGLDRPASASASASSSASSPSSSTTPKALSDIMPTSWLETMTSPPVLRALIAVIGSAPALMFVLNWTSQYLVEGLHVPKDDVANYLIPAPLVFDFGAIGFGAIASTRREPSNGGKTNKDLILISMLLAASLVFAPLAKSPEQAIAICAMAAAGGGGIYALVTADMLARVPVARTSAAGGMTAAAQSLAHIIASPLVGYSIDRTHNFNVALICLGAIVVPTSLIFVLWPRMDDQRGIA